MKYFLIKQIVANLKQKAQVIKLIRRVDNNIIIIKFNNNESIFFDMSKGNSLIYKRKEEANSKKDFNAPFDVVLKKRMTNAKIEDIKMYNDDKIINIDVSSSSSYKKLKTTLQLEFTGKYTNAIILDENRMILEALRHIDEYSSSRVVKVGIKLDEIPKQNFIPKMEKVDDIEEYLYNVYEKIQEQNINNIKKQKINQVKKKLTKLEKILNSLPKKEDLEEQSNILYEKANIILSHLHQIKPYQKTLKAKNFLGEDIEINLDEKASPSTYCNELFKKAKKNKHKASSIKIEKDNLEEKTEFLKRLIRNLENSQSIDEMEFIYPKKEKSQARVKKAQNYESFFFEGYKIMLGTSERENIYLLKNSKASDFWFHLKDRPSSHVIVQNSKKTIPQSVIEKAASLCAKFSLDYSGVYEVDYTQRRNVKVQSGADVLYNPYTTQVVKI